MKKQNRAWKKRERKTRHTRVPHYSSPTASILALQQNAEFEIYQIVKGHDNRMLTRNNWKYSSSKRTLQC